jgi:hypothetical protein
MGMVLSSDGEKMMYGIQRGIGRLHIMREPLWHDTPFDKNLYGLNM